MMCFFLLLCLAILQSEFQQYAAHLHKSGLPWLPCKLFSSMVHDSDPITHTQPTIQRKNIVEQHQEPIWVNVPIMRYSILHEISDWKPSQKESICNPVLESEELIVCLLVSFLSLPCFWGWLCSINLYNVLLGIKKHKHATYLFQLSSNTLQPLRAAWVYAFFFALLAPCGIGHLSRTPSCRPPLKCGWEIVFFSGDQET